jgi:hypothetical protein
MGRTVRHIFIPFRKYPVFITLLLAVTLPLLPAEQVPTWEWKDIDRVVAVGDIHGMIDSFRKILKRSGLVDESFHWQGGAAHLVLCGDLVGRGEYEKDVLDLVIAHTPSRFGRIQSRYQSKILRTDVAMVYDQNMWGFLVYEGGEFKAMGARNPDNVPYEEAPGGENYSSIMEQLPPKQLENYLRRAKILSKITEFKADDGRLLPVYETEYKEQKERVAFNFLEEKYDKRNPQSRLRSYKHMVAAYRISRILEYDIVPTTIIRKIDGREGSFGLYPGNTVNRQMFETDEQVDEATKGMGQELSDARAFLALLDIEGQDDQGKMLLRKERRLIMADLTKGFSESHEIRDEFFAGNEKGWKVGRPLDPFLELKLRELNRKELRKKCKGLLTDGQIDALLGRRDRLLEHSASLAQR